MPDGEWSHVTLGEVLGVSHGYAFKGEFFDDAGSQVLLTPKNFRPEGGLDLSEDRCKWYDGPMKPGYLLEFGDVVVAMTDLKQDAPILGSAGTVPAGRACLHNQRIGKVEINNPAMLDRRFVPWLLNSPHVRRAVRASATGATVRHTAPSRIEEIEVDLPTLGEQRRIASILLAFDKLIDINKRRVELLETSVRAVHRRFKGASQVEVDEIAVLIRESTKPAGEPETTFEHFSIPAYDNGQLPARELGSRIKSAKFRIRQPSVLLSKLNPRIPRVWLVMPQDSNAVASSEFLVWEGRAVSNAWLWCQFLDYSFRGMLVGSAQGTSTSHQRISPQDVKRARIDVPPRSVLEEFDAFALPALDLAAELRTHSEYLIGVRDLLLPRLVTGKLDISHSDLSIVTPTEPE